MFRTTRVNFIAVATVATIALAACGGAGPAATTAPGGGGTSSTQQPTGGGTGGGGATRAPVATQSSGGGGGDLADPCSLLTADEVGLVYSQTGVKPTVTDGAYNKICTYMPASGNVAMLWVEVTPFATRPCDKWRSVGMEVPGLGEWAFWRDDSAELYVKTGDRCLMLSDHFNTLDDTQKTLTELAHMALDRL